MYWAVILTVWKVFEYLTFLPWLALLRTAATVALVSPKLGLIPKLYTMTYEEGPIKDKIDMVRGIVQSKI